MIFFVSTHKEATLEFNSKSELKDGQYLVSGQLTIKGITNPIDFTIEPKMIITLLFLHLIEPSTMLLTDLETFLKILVID